MIIFRLFGSKSINIISVTLGCEYGDRITGCDANLCGSYATQNPNKLKSCCATCSGYIGAVTRTSRQTTERTTAISTKQTDETTQSTGTPEPTGPTTGQTTPRPTPRPTTSITTHGDGSAAEQGGDSGEIVSKIIMIVVQSIEIIKGLCLCLKT